jgi:hypothetical protein
VEAFDVTLITDRPEQRRYMEALLLIAEIEDRYTPGGDAPERQEWRRERERFREERLQVAKMEEAAREAIQRRSGG